MRAPRPRLLHLPAAVLIVGCAMGTTCEESVDIDVEVTHEAPEALGHVLFVTIYPNSTVSDGFPFATDVLPQHRFMKLLNSAHADDFRIYLIELCFPQTRIVAWIDMNDSSGEAPFLEPGKEVSRSTSDAPFARADLFARPDAGDWIAVSDPIDAERGGGGCLNDSVDFELEPKPLK